MAHTFVRIDASNYTSVPRINAQSGVGLTRAMLVALPKDPAAPVKHAARAARAAAVKLQAANGAAAEAASADTSPRNARVIDNEADALHGAVLRRLADHALLAGHDDGLAASIATLKRALYPDGGDFLRGDMLTQWQATEEWYERLVADGREKALRAAVGDAFVDALAAVHAEYGTVVGTTAAQRRVPAKVDLATPLAALAERLQDLALQLVALANDGGASDDHRAAAREALAPIDRHRASNARRGAA
ncbi:MAG: hypothetical protein Q8S73_42585, partial [Deltaproteobacteria bacterium]|nr:hypothetical protein [Deltaproteobacteria bacterium]